MLIETIEVSNFRSIKKESLQCENLTVLIGRNGSGKSSFLRALDVFYDVAASISIEDFFNHETGEPIEIRVSYGNFRDEEKKEFSTYISNNQLIVTKRILLDADTKRFIQRYYAAALQIPQFAEIRALSGKKERLSTWNELFGTSELLSLPARAKKADEVDSLMADYENKHPELMKPIEREEQFFGPKNIGGGKLDKYTKFVLVPAVREASDEVIGKKGIIYQLLDMIVLRRIDARKDIHDFKSEVEGKIKKLYSSENLTELPELGDSISKTLARFAPGSELKLKWGDVKPPEMPLPAAKATLIEDNFEGDVSYKGHGLQRALVLSLLQHLAMIPSPKEVSAKEGDAVDREFEEQILIEPDFILAIEEPELFLHPARCRYLSEVLLRLTSNNGIAGRNQVIYATHSPYFVDLYRFDNIRLVRKITKGGLSTPFSILTKFTLNEVAQKLAEICEADPKNFTRDTLIARSVAVMNIIVNEGFFADTVVIVEGMAEVGALWKMQEILSKNWSELGIAVVPAGSKNNIDRPVIIFCGLKIPTYFIFDADSHSTKGVEETKKRNRRYLRLATAREEDFPTTQVNDTWAVFNKNLESTFKDELTESTFISIRGKVNSELRYDEPDRVFKNSEGVARFVEQTYKEKQKLKILEQIVEKITTLAIKSRGVGCEILSVE